MKGQQKLATLQALCVAATSQPCIFYFLQSSNCLFYTPAAPGLKLVHKVSLYGLEKKTSLLEDAHSSRLTQEHSLVDRTQAGLQASRTLASCPPLQYTHTPCRSVCTTICGCTSTYISVFAAEWKLFTQPPYQIIIPWRPETILFNDR